MSQPEDAGSGINEGVSRRAAETTLSEGAGEQVKPVYFWVLLSELPPGGTTHMYGEPFCLESDQEKLTRVTHSCLPFS